MSPPTATLDKVKEYYGRVLRTSADLKTTACCAAERLPPAIAAIVSQIHPEVQERFYGCGVIAPVELEGRTVLDLGSGSGRDVYVMSKLVGPKGRVIGVDMTDEQMAVAEKHRGFHAAAFGHATSNVQFVKGYIEDLEGAGIASNSVDVVVSNCVLNLSPAKERVFAEIFRVLKPGGELCFSDVFVDRRLPAACQEDPVLLGECLGGAMYGEDFRRMIARAGCLDARTVSSSPIAITDDDIARKVGNAKFHSRTVRAFKLPLEDRCEDYGQIATYLGTLPEAPHAWALDDHHLFETGRPMLVCDNTFQMLGATRLAKHFRLQGEKTTHFGLFPCGPAPAATDGGGTTGGACC